MISKYTDLRVMKTKEAIQNALFDLIEEKGFERITVTDIAVKAKVNRGTFYTHYEDKFDLFTEYKEKFMSELSVLFEHFHSTMVEEAKKHNPDQDSIPCFITRVIGLLYENRRFVEAVVNTDANECILSELENFVGERLFGANAIIEEDKILVPKLYLTTYIVNAFMGVIRKWLSGGAKETPEEIAQILSVMNLGGVFYASGSQVV